MVGKTFHELAYPADLATKLQRQVKEVYHTKKSITDETPFILADGELGFYEYIFSPAVGPNGNVDFVVGSTRDITDRRRGEEKLRISEANLAKSQEIAHRGSWEMDVVQDTTLQYGDLRWSDEVFRIFGYRPGQIAVSYERFLESVHPDDRAGITAAMTETLRDGTE